MKTLIRLTLVFGIFLAGITPAMSQGVLIGTIDVSGDGVVDNLYNSGSSLTVVRGNGGGTRAYFISSGSWSLAFGNSSSIVNLDGIAGAEIPVNTGNALMVITDKTQSTVSYAFSGSWSVAPSGITDMDGLAGAEIAVLNGSTLTVVTQRLGSRIDYYVGTSWSIPSGGIKDLDGFSGAEIPIVNGQNLTVVTPRTGSTSNYLIGTNWAVVPTGITDMDGTAGAEIAIVNGTNLKVVTPRTGGTSSYSIGTTWAVATSGVNGVSDMDGIAGADIAIVSGSALIVVVPRSNAINTYSMGSSFAILSNGIQDLDGTVGNDIVVSVSGSGQLRTIHPKDGSISPYSTAVTGSGWSLQGYANLDGLPGMEIKIHSFTFNKDLVVNDRNKTIS